MVPKDSFDESVRREVLADGDRKPESAEEKGHNFLCPNMQHHEQTLII